MNTSVNRRRFLGGAVTAAAAGTAATSFSALGAKAGAAPATASAPNRVVSGDYGPLSPVRDQATGLELLALPRGFEYISYGWTNDPMRDGSPTPASHDGMAAFRDGDLVRLVRNHERGNGTPFSAPAVYDSTSAGGTTNLAFDPDAGQWIESYGSLSGTLRNCAGGLTPWGSWLTCEETTQINNAGTPAEVRHGYVFDVPADGAGDPTPLRNLGRFSHEGTCTDPNTGIVYLTEDATPSGFYRFVPANGPEDLTQGTLEMLAVDGLVATYGADTGDTWSARWVSIDQPDPGIGEMRTVDQGMAKGGTAIARGEGIWWGNDRVYFTSTSGGPAGQGQVFEYDPVSERLTVLFASPDSRVLNAPDNVCVSPRGGLVVCEDGSGAEYLHGLTLDGEIFRFAENIVDLRGGTAGKNVSASSYTGSEWAGATFDPKVGNWLFVNLQSPGFTVAITGPWRKGAL